MSGKPANSMAVIPEMMLAASLNIHPLKPPKGVKKSGCSIDTVQFSVSPIRLATIIP